MTRRGDPLRQAFEHIDEGWDAARSERTLPEVRGRFRRSQVRRALTGAVAGAALAVAGVALWLPERERAAEPAAAGGLASPSVASPGRHMRFADGSELELLDAAARVTVEEVSEETVVVSLLAGRVRVSVVPDRDRTFRVDAGPVEIVVLGTAFELAREAGRTHVTVLHGRVAVQWRGGAAELAAGEAGWYPEPGQVAGGHEPPQGLRPLSADGLAPPSVQAPGGRERGAVLQPLAADGWASRSVQAPGGREPGRDLQPAAAKSGGSRRSGLVPGAREAGDDLQPGRSRVDPAGSGEPIDSERSRSRSREHRRRTERAERGRLATKGGEPGAEVETWQAQAERGDYGRAYARMPRRPEAVSDDVHELLLAADAARLSGHPEDAVPFLRRVVDRHPSDPRASLAAFTLGGVLLSQLDRASEAEAAYARARGLALSPALAQDALARQVEAAHRAGDGRRARELAAEYVRRYPEGRRLRWVRKLGGL